MKLPEQVDILGLMYKVNEVAVVNKTIPRNGEIDFQKQEIRIDNELSDDRKMIVLLHEAIHGILEALGLDDLCDNENVVQSLAIALYHAFKNQLISS